MVKRATIRMFQLSFLLFCLLLAFNGETGAERG